MPIGTRGGMEGAAVSGHARRGPHRAMTRRAVIIGGGLGGLATAVRLGAQGWRVTLCEHGETLGGKMNRASAQGFVFDTGPSLITMPWIFESLFTAAGSRLDAHLELVE